MIALKFEFPQRNSEPQPQSLRQQQLQSTRARSQAGNPMSQPRQTSQTSACHLLIMQVVGFFLVERSVQLLLPGLVDPSQVALLWEAASEVLKSTLDRELRAINDSPILLLLKDWVLLLCSALEGCGCSGDPMREVLLSSRG